MNRKTLVAIILAMVLVGTLATVISKAERARQVRQLAMAENASAIVVSTASAAKNTKILPLQVPGNPDRDCFFLPSPARG